MGDFKEMKSDSEMERFGPLRVLLVEPDDSTRNIIAALLRKCSYQVTTVSDGLRAWETLKGGPKGIDLILTEVELPSISGYALLTLIMEHDICKNIPVIMMSPKDSISISLKCMSRGAADFLIKPVRKNELRNLWQHVWRRQTGQHQITIESQSACRLSNTRMHQESNQKLTASKLHVYGISKVKDVEIESENHTQNVYLHEKNYKVSDSSTEATDFMGKFVTSRETYNHVSANDIEENPFTKLELSLKTSNTSGLEDVTSEDIFSLNHSKDSPFSRYVSLSLLQDTPSKEDCSMDFHKDAKSESLDVIRHQSDNKLSLKRCGSISDASEVNNTEASGGFSKATLSESVNDNNVLASDGSRDTSSHHNSQREAALYKFRLKRKDRCYEKKVRYQSRQKLAEKRPRVKGQFVRRDAI